MQLDVGIEPTLRFSGMTCIDKQMDQSESKVHIFRVISIYLIETDMRALVYLIHTFLVHVIKPYYGFLGSFQTPQGVNRS